MAVWYWTGSTIFTRTHSLLSHSISGGRLYGGWHYGTILYFGAALVLEPFCASARLFYRSDVLSQASVQRKMIQLSSNREWTKWDEVVNGINVYCIHTYIVLPNAVHCTSISTISTHCFCKLLINSTLALKAVLSAWYNATSIYRSTHPPSLMSNDSSSHFSDTKT